MAHICMGDMMENYWLHMLLMQIIWYFLWLLYLLIKKIIIIRDGFYFGYKYTLLVNEHAFCIILDRHACIKNGKVEI